MPGTAANAWRPPASVLTVPFTATSDIIESQISESSDGTSLEVWPHELKIGAALPSLPLFLSGGLCFPLDLEESYLRTCQEYRISLNGK